MFHYRKRMFQHVTHEKILGICSYVTKMLYLCPQIITTTN